MLNNWIVHCSLVNADICFSLCLSSWLQRRKKTDVYYINALSLYIFFISCSPHSIAKTNDDRWSIGGRQQSEAHMQCISRDKSIEWIEFGGAVRISSIAIRERWFLLFGSIIFRTHALPSCATRFYIFGKFTFVLLTALHADKLSISLHQCRLPIRIRSLRKKFEEIKTGSAISLAINVCHYMVSIGWAVGIDRHKTLL